MSDSPDGDRPAGTDRTGTAIRALSVTYLKGLTMGAADAVPGVSGGTIALIVGVYERLIRALTSLDPSVLRHLPRLHRAESRSAFVADIRGMDVPFLFALGFGMVTAVAILSRFVEIALEVFPASTFAFFFGLIAASAFVLFEREWLGTPKRAGAALAGFVLAFLVAGASSQGLLPSSLPVVFVAGMFAISGMVLPGISGAFILLLVGQYDYMASTLNRFLDGVFALVGGSPPETLLADTLVIVTFVVGALVGLFTVALLVRAALERYRHATLAFLVSLMVGSLRLPVVRVLAETGTWTGLSGARVGVALVTGVALVVVLDHYTADFEVSGP